MDVLMKWLSADAETVRDPGSQGVCDQRFQPLPWWGGGGRPVDC